MCSTIPFCIFPLNSFFFCSCALSFSTRILDSGPSISPSKARRKPQNRIPRHGLLRAHGTCDRLFSHSLERTLRWCRRPQYACETPSQSNQCGLLSPQRIPGAEFSHLSTGAHHEVGVASVSSCNPSFFISLENWGADIQSTCGILRS